MTSRTATLRAPATAINLKYNLCNVEPGASVEVFIRDVESLKSEGWTSTEPKKANPPRRRPRRKKKVK